MENVSSCCLALVALCCADKRPVAFLPFFLTHCGVMSCVFALSVVASCVTDFTTSHAWLKSPALCHTHFLSLHPRHTAVVILKEIQKQMETRRRCPGDFEGRIILMSMFNDTDWTKKEKSKDCISNSLKVRDYA